MTTLFPAGIDSFDIKSPQEIIRAVHVNDIQESIVAIEVFVIGLEQTINNHINQGADAHDAQAISVASTVALNGGDFPITALNVQAALEQLKAAIEAVEDQDADLTAFIAHLNADINSAHPGLIQGTKIAAGQIGLNHLNFDPATQAELDAHAAMDKSTAHPGTIENTDIALGTITTDRLAFDVATQAELDAHITSSTAHNASQIVVTPAINGQTNVQAALTNLDGISDAHIAATQGVHGVGTSTSGSGYTTTPILQNAVVGRLDKDPNNNAQRLENKLLISAFQGTKALFFTNTNEELEREAFAPYTVGASDTQLAVRQPASTRSTNSSTLTGSVIVVPVASTALFTVSSAVRVRIPSTYNLGTSFTGTVSAITVGVSLTLTFSGSVAIPANSLITNEAIANPLFAVEPTGIVKINTLEVANFAGGFTVSGDLVVTGNTTLGVGGGDLTTITGVLSLVGTGSTTGNFTVGSLLTAGTISSGNITSSGNLITSGSSSFGGTTTSAGNIIGHSNLLIDGYGTFGGTVTASSYTALTGNYNGINLPQFRTDFNNHLPHGLYLNVALAGYNHHTDQLAYSSLRTLTDNLPPGYTGVVEQSLFAVPFNPSDGYIQVQRVGTLEVGDSVAVGDGYYGYGDLPAIPPFFSGHGRTITSIDLFAVPYPKIFLNSYTDLTLLSTAKKAKLIKKVAYDGYSSSSLSDVIDTLAIDFYDHTLHGTPYPAHRTTQVVSDPFDFSSQYYTPTVNAQGDVDVQSVFDEIGEDLYNHLDGYHPNGLGPDDGYYPHFARVIAFDNTVAGLGRIHHLIVDGYSGNNFVYVAQGFAYIKPGDSVILQDDLPFTPEPFHVTLVDNTNKITLDGYLARNYDLDDNGYLKNLSIETVQEALEAVATVSDVTNHINDGYHAHNAKAIGVDGSSGMPGFLADNVAQAFVELAGTSWNSASDINLWEHLHAYVDGYLNVPGYHFTVHDGYDIAYDGYSTLLQAISPYTGMAYGPVTWDDVQEALDRNYRFTHDHINIPTDAHNASAISYIDTNVNFIATEVQGAIDGLNNKVDGYYSVLDGYINNHLNDTIDAHDASAISYNNVDGYIPTTTVQGALDLLFINGDLPHTSAVISNNQVALASVTGLLFNPTVVRSAHIEYSIRRYHLTPFVDVTSVGTFRIIYKPTSSTWQWDETFAGDNVGVNLTVAPSGQVQYTSTNLGSAPVESVIKFRAKVTKA